MNNRLVRITTFCFLALCLVFPAAANPAPKSDRPLVVVTYNMYLGTDFGPILVATSFPEFANAVAAAYVEVQQSNIPERAEAIAKEIASKRPELVGLQEVSIWRTGPFGGPANTVTFDALQSLLDELAERNLHYSPVAIVTEFEAEAPSALGINISFTDRDVVLARTDLNPSELILSNIQAHNFATNLMFVTPILGPLTIPRGWISVDGKVRGKSFRFVNTHLESFHPGIQAIQASELMLGPCNTPLPVVLVGDFNTDAPGGDPSQNAGYQIILSSGFADGWSLLHAGDPGYTWALHTGDSVTSITPTQRLDLMLFRGEIEAEGLEPLGESLSDLTPSGLWPSDHAGLAAFFDLKAKAD
jgi:endonuclease/exonuclease/phosphatase family metal-dependent hydrolase